MTHAEHKLSKTFLTPPPFGLEPPKDTATISGKETHARDEALPPCKFARRSAPAKSIYFFLIMDAPWATVYYSSRQANVTLY